MDRGQLNEPVRLNRLDQLGLPRGEDVDQGPEVARLPVVGDEALGQFLHLGLERHPVRSETKHFL